MPSVQGGKRGLSGARGTKRETGMKVKDNTVPGRSPDCAECCIIAMLSIWWFFLVPAVAILGVWKFCELVAKVFD